MRAAELTAWEAHRTITGPLLARAESDPDGVFVRFDGSAITNGEAWRRCGELAGGLASLGVGKGSHVAIMLANSPAFLLTWFALARLGAVEVPVNTAFVGTILRHVLTDSDADVLVIGGETEIDALLALEELPERLTTIVAVNASPESLSRLRGLGRRVAQFDDLGGDCPATEVDTHDTAAIMYTSGTTGASKGVVLSHRYFLLVGIANAANMRLGPADRYLTCLPLFHGMAQLSGTMAPLISGAEIVLVRRFSVSAFWNTCRENGVTAFGAIAAMMSMLSSVPPAPESDRDHAVRYAFAVATPASLHDAFEARFGVRLVNGYGLTEASMLTYCPYDDRRPGSSGVPLPIFEVEIHDADDQPLPAGTVGEIVCRPRTPGATMTGYYKRPEATLEAWRNLWLHTGDLGRFDDDGFLWFVDRQKDAIRRRGENISSFELETEIAAHPEVEEVAAYPVPSPLGEDDVMIAVVRGESSLTAEDLHAFCRGRLPAFATPRHIRFMGSLPHTPTNKVRKPELREQGVTADTWTAP